MDALSCPSSILNHLATKQTEKMMKKLVSTQFEEKKEKKKKILFYRNRKGLHFISARVQYVPVSLPWSVLELE